MKVTTVYCDACGRQAEEYHSIKDMDFCEDCWPAVVETVRRLAAEMIGAQPDEMIKAEEVPEAPKAPARGSVDKAKAQALRDAGWTLQQIADELHCHPGYISKITAPAKAKARKPLEWTGQEVGA